MACSTDDGLHLTADAAPAVDVIPSHDGRLLAVVSAHAVHVWSLKPEPMLCATCRSSAAAARRICHSEDDFEHPPPHQSAAGPRRPPIRPTAGPNVLYGVRWPPCRMRRCMLGSTVALQVRLLPTPQPSLWVVVEEEGRARPTPIWYSATGVESCCARFVRRRLRKASSHYSARRPRLRRHPPPLRPLPITMMAPRCPPMAARRRRQRPPWQCDGRGLHLSSGRRLGWRSPANLLSPPGRWCADDDAATAVRSDDKLLSAHER